jgi:hypothetical protein
MVEGSGLFLRKSEKKEPKESSGVKKASPLGKQRAGRVRETRN